MSSDGVPQQTAPLINNNNNHHNTVRTSPIAKWLGIVIQILRILLWPLRTLVGLLFPYHDTDGLSPAVTAKSAQQFIGYIRSLGLDSESWASTGFAALKQEAVSQQSLIFVYLHAPLHSESRNFCDRVLGQEPFRSWLQQDNVIGCGLSIHTAQGAQLQTMLQINSFPAVAVLQPAPNNNSNTLHLVMKLEGTHSCTLPNLMPQLLIVQQRHQTSRAEHETRRIVREQEIELRRQQDEEYQDTLRADQERERAAAVDRDAALAAAAKEQATARRKAENEATALGAARALAGDEPESGGTMIRFCLPNGKKINRRFPSDRPIAALKAFLKVHCYDNNLEMGTIGLSSNYPRRTYNDNEDRTLEEAELAPQALLMVQDLDA